MDKKHPAKYGVVADTHDNYELTQQIINIFEDQKCTHVFHCGDFSNSRIYDLFTDRDFSFHYVTGNHDIGIPPNEKLDIRLPDPREGVPDTVRIGAYHNTFTKEGFKTVVWNDITSQDYDIYFHGHIHWPNFKLPSDDNHTLAINPGSLYNEPELGVFSFVIFDLASCILHMYTYAGADFVKICSIDIFGRTMSTKRPAEFEATFNKLEKYLGAQEANRRARGKGRYRFCRGCDDDWLHLNIKNLSGFLVNESNLSEAGNSIKNSDVQSSSTTFDVGGVDMEFVRVPGGEGNMDREQKSETLTTPYLLSATPVTIAQWQAVMGNIPAGFQEPDSLPVGVSWYDAIAFCNKLSQECGFFPAYRLFDETGTPGNGDYYIGKMVWESMPTGPGFRLPSEAEWEYACIAAEQNISNTLDNDKGWHFRNSDKQPHPVGEKKPNRWRLHDMLGNVWEWCWDLDYEYESWLSWGQRSYRRYDTRAMRGGSFRMMPGSISPAVRNEKRPDWDQVDVGFRCAISLL